MYCTIECLCTCKVLNAGPVFAFYFIYCFDFSLVSVAFQSGFAPFTLFLLFETVLVSFLNYNNMEGTCQKKYLNSYTALLEGC